MQQDQPNRRARPGERPAGHVEGGCPCTTAASRRSPCRGEAPGDQGGVTAPARSSRSREQTGRTAGRCASTQLDRLDVRAFRATARPPLTWRRGAGSATAERARATHERATAHERGAEEQAGGIVVRHRGRRRDRERAAFPARGSGAPRGRSARPEERCAEPRRGGAAAGEARPRRPATRARCAWWSTAPRRLASPRSRAPRRRLWLALAGAELPAGRGHAGGRGAASAPSDDRAGARRPRPRRWPPPRRPAEAAPAAAAAR